MYSGIVTSEAGTAPTSAIQRAGAASRSRPIASTSDAGDDRHPDGEAKDKAVMRRASAHAPTTISSANTPMIIVNA